MPTLDTIPAEIRLQIYSYLLSDAKAFAVLTLPDNECGECNIRKKPKFTTGLFLVNRKISIEALQYFYRENAFIAVYVDKTTLQICLSLFPALHWDVEIDSGDSFDPPVHLRPLHLSEMALEIRFVYFSNRLISLPRDNLVLVFGVRYLPILIRFFNNFHYEKLSKGVRVDARLKFNLGNRYYLSNRSVSNRVISALRTLRSSVHTSGHLGLTFSAGSFIESRDLSALQDFSFPDYSDASLLEDLKWPLQQAAKETQLGCYKSAESFLRLWQFF